MRPYKVLIVMAALMLAPATGYAAPTTFVANLTGALEVPASGSPATGSATVVLDQAANTLSVHVTFSGLGSGTTASHIHCCLDSIFATGVNIGVATTTPTFPRFPLGVTSGTYDTVLDLTQSSSYNPAFVTAQGGTIAKAEAELIRGIVNGETYLNVHTTNFPGGEIRGFPVAQAAPTRLSLLKLIPITGTATNKSNKAFFFDISWVDPANGLYYVADRSNAAIDVIDTTGAFTGTPDTLFGQIGGAAVGFQGDTGSNSTSGPDGIVAAFPCIFASDGNSRVVSFNAAASFTTPVSSLSTGGPLRADKMAYDPKDGMLLVSNPDSAFATLIAVNKSTCALSNPIKIPFDAAHGVNATNGVNQPAWDPATQRFYVSLPEIDGPGDGTGITGAVARVNTSGVIETVYPINYCQPAGLTAGPNGDLLVGCNSVFDTAGNRCSAVVASPAPAGSPVGHPATCTGVAFPQSAICNPSRGCTGNALVSVPGAGGGDEIYFNAGDGNYYITAAMDPKGPLLGVIASGTSPTQPNTLIQVVPTLPPVPAVLVAPGIHSMGNVHIVAASAANNHVYVPLPATTSYPNCAQGCVAVFGAQ
jgi:CHRD domain